MWTALWPGPPTPRTGNCCTPSAWTPWSAAREIETDTIRQLLSLGGGTASLNEILLPEDFAFAGKSIKDIPIPGNAILVSITRDTEFIIPHGNTVLLPWDRILCLTQDDTLHLLTDAWGLTGK